MGVVLLIVLYWFELSCQPFAVAKIIFRVSIPTAAVFFNTVSPNIYAVFILFLFS